jgi:hypothetical protein
MSPPISPKALATPSAEAPREYPWSVGAGRHRLAAAMQRGFDLLAGQQRTFDLHEVHVAWIVDSGITHRKTNSLDRLFDLHVTIHYQELMRPHPPKRQIPPVPRSLLGFCA